MHHSHRLIILFSPGTNKTIQSQLISGYTNLDLQSIWLIHLLDILHEIKETFGHPQEYLAAKNYKYQY